jgi:lysophospholipase L1-like esterase
VHNWQSYIALGDCFTEGLYDRGIDGQFRGWADRLAELLAREQPALRYANLAVRGKYLRQVLAHQYPYALAAKPDLVSFCVGGNDIMRPKGDPEALALSVDKAVAELRAAGSDVLIFTGFDTRKKPVLNWLHGRIVTYNGHLKAIADRHGAYLVDMWSMIPLADSRAWNADRLHLSSEGHQRVALNAATVLGLTLDPEVDGRWDEPWPPAARPTWLELRRSDLNWTSQYLWPWFTQFLRGGSSGTNRKPKRPELAPLLPFSRDPGLMIPMPASGTAAATPVIG